MVLEDGREYVFPLFSVIAEGKGVFLESRTFLGPAFFVSKQGDAITADHIVPTPDQLGEKRRLVAVVARNGSLETCWITHVAKFAAFDVALLHVNLTDTRYLPIASTEVPPGSDVEVIGIPSHEVWSGGKEMRILKGHVTMAVRGLELSCAIPTGMSGSPVFMRGSVVAYATGNVRSEEVEDSSEEVTETSEGGKVIRRTEVHRALYYGLARPFSDTIKASDPILNGKTLPDFVKSRNDEP